LSADEPIDVIVARALGRLREPSSASLHALVELLIEAALARPIETAIDPDRVVALAVTTLERSRIEAALAKLGRPAWERQRALLARRGDRVGDWLPEGGRAVLEEVVVGARTPSGEWTRGLVDPSDVRELIAPVLQDTLLTFARKLPLVGNVADAEGPARAAGKLFGMARELAQTVGEKASERAGKLADIGRGVLGGLGGEMEKRVVQAAREYSQSAVEPLETAFVARLRSDEGREILARIRSRVIDRVLAARAADVLADLDTLPRAPLDALIAQAIAFGVRRPETAEMLRAEVAAFVAEHDGKTVGEVLDAWGLRETAITEARRELRAIASATASDTRAGAWLRALLEP
jgi:hypothetical protein